MVSRISLNATGKILQALRKYFFASLKFVAPFFVWVFLFRDFLSGKIAVINDGFSFYGGIKFYLDNIRSGVYPLWNPYALWGMPYEINVRQMGEYNPMLYLILLLNQLGASFYHSFTGVVTLYYFLGLIGFYLLLKAVIKDSAAAYAGFVMLMFSSVGMTLFNQLIMLLLWVPAVWFLYFLMRFVGAWQKHFLFGLTSCAVLIATTYLPFYFLTVFLSFLVFFVFLYPVKARNIYSGFMAFAKSHKMALLVCLLVIVVSLIPPVLTYQSMSTADTIVPTRHFDDSLTSGKGPAMAYDELKRGGLSDKMSWRQLFGGLQETSYDNDGFIFLPFFSFLVLLVSLGSVLKKRSVLLSCWGFSLFLLALANASPVHRFLFEHLFYFKLFRNLYFLTPFLISIYIAFVAEQLRVFLQEKPDSKINTDFFLSNIQFGKYSQKNPHRKEKVVLPSSMKITEEKASKYGAIILATVVFVLFFAFLKSQEDVAFSSYLTLGLGYAFFVAYDFGLSQRGKKLWMIGVIVLMMVQPADMMGAYARNSSAIQNPIIRDGITREYKKPSFYFMRPEYTQGKDEDLTGLKPTHLFNWYVLSMQDSPGFIAYRYNFPTRWAYELSQKIAREDLKGYVKHKFVIYDNTAEGDDANFSSLREALRTNQNTVFIASDNRGGQKSEAPVRENAPAAKNFLAITGDSGRLSVLSYNVNAVELRTNFDAEKFLVYNDSFHSGWKAFVNGKKVPLYRANDAFKGIWLPKGENVVLFRFMPSGGEWFYFSLVLFFLAFFMFTVFQFFRGGVSL